MSYNITQFGKPLDKSLYEIDKKKKTFSSMENYLILNFDRSSGWNFKTGSCCMFKAGWDCNFNTGWGCVFFTFSRCIFETEEECTFHTDEDCIFNTGDDCTFNVWRNFNKIKTKGNSIVLVRDDILRGSNSSVIVRDKEVHTYLEDEVEIYFNKKNNEILYTKEKWTGDKYKMMRELIR